MLAVMRETMRTRYQLLHYLYTRFYRAHTQGETVARPVLHEFPLDRTARDLDSQYMLGPALMVAPFFDEDQVTRTVYLPNSDRWYKMAGHFVESVTPDSQNQTELVDSESSRPLLLRGGSILPVVAERRLPQIGRA